MSFILALRMQRQVALHQGYTERHCLKEQMNDNNRKNKCPYKGRAGPRATRRTLPAQFVRLVLLPKRRWKEPGVEYA